MKLIKDNVKIVCDIKGCNNLAVYKLVLDVGESECVRICDKCLQKFYDEVSKKLGKKVVESAKN